MTATRDITSIMKTHFTNLTDTEQRTRRELERAYDGHLSRIMAAVMEFLTDEAPITARVSRDTARRIDAAARSAGIVMRFDELNRLTRAGAMSAEVEAIQAAYAREAHAILMESFEESAGYLWGLIMQAYDVGPLSSGALARILTDTSYPIETTLINSLMRAGRRTAMRAMQARAQGRDTLDIMRDVTEYARRTTRHACDAVEFYEDTRISVDIEFEAFEVLDVYYYRTRCVHDRRTCSICLGIEAEQERRPVRVTDKQTGINSPPYHPFCRCWIEDAEPDEEV